MAILTPGLRFLGRLLLSLTAPVPIVVFGKQFVLPRLGVQLDVPTWQLILASFCVLPISAVANILTKSIQHRRAATAMGARLAPRFDGKLPGNVDTVYRWMQLARTGYPGEQMRECMRNLGPVFDFHLFWEPMLVTTQPEHLQLILATDFNNYVKGQWVQEYYGPLLGSGVFIADGDMWKFHRAMTRPFFSKDRISHFEMFDRYCDQVITLMKARLRTGYPVEFQDLMLRFTMDAASEFLFGSKMNSLHASELPYPHNADRYAKDAVSQRQNDPALAFSDAFLEAQLMGTTRLRLGPIWPLREIREDRFLKPMKGVDAFVEPIVMDALAKKRTRDEEKKYMGSQGGDEKDIRVDATLLDHLVEQTADPKLLKDQTLNILLAGRDTTAVTLTFIFYALSLYPQITARLRQEIIDHVGLTGKPTFEGIKGMKYLRAVINETLRLYPVVAFNRKQSVNAATWPSPDPNEKPVYVPAGCQVLYSVFLMHRRTDLWGPDAEVFDPDRFLDDRLKKYLTPRPFIFLPFNAGPRICLGQQFAYNEISFMVIRILQSFTSFSLNVEAFEKEFWPPAAWKTRAGRCAEEQIWPKATTALYSAGGMWLNATEVSVE